MSFVFQCCLWRDTCRSCLLIKPYYDWSVRVVALRLNWTEHFNFLWNLNLIWFACQLNYTDTLNSKLVETLDPYGFPVGSRMDWRPLDCQCINSKTYMTTVIWSACWLPICVDHHKNCLQTGSSSFLLLVVLCLG